MSETRITGATNAQIEAAAKRAWDSLNDAEQSETSGPEAGATHTVFDTKTEKPVQRYQRKSHAISVCERLNLLENSHTRPQRTLIDCPTCNGIGTYCYLPENSVCEICTDCNGYGQVHPGSTVVSLISDDKGAGDE